MTELEGFWPEALETDLEQLQEHFQALKQEILQSKTHILSLGENWDGEGSSGFQEEHWLRAATFVKDLVLGYWTTFHAVIATPSILPVADGSIDVTWNTGNMLLTVNFPPSNDLLPCFYGKDDAGNEVEGMLQAENLNAVVIPWLQMMS